MRTKGNSFKLRDMLYISVLLILCIVTFVQQLNIEKLSENSSSNISSPFITAVAQVRESVVGITVYKQISVSSQKNTFSENKKEELCYSESGHASGVVVGNGLVLTNYHVVQDMKKITVTPLKDSEATEEMEAVLIDYDAANDLAVMRVNDLNISQVKIGDSDGIVQGDWVICVANPATLKLAGSVSVGVISALNRQVESAGEGDSYTAMFQTDAAINAGSSGGGIFNTDGELVGIAAKKYTGVGASDTQLEGIGMCIPINSAKILIDNAASQLS